MSKLVTLDENSPSIKYLRKKDILMECLFLWDLDFQVA